MRRLALGRFAQCVQQYLRGPRGVGRRELLRLPCIGVQRRAQLRTQQVDIDATTDEQLRCLTRTVCDEDQKNGLRGDRACAADTCFMFNSLDDSESFIAERDPVRCTTNARPESHRDGGDSGDNCKGIDEDRQ